MATAGLATYALRTTGPREVQISGSFLPNGSSAVGTVYGAGFTVARTGTGVFRVTITRPFAWFKSLCVNITTDDTDDHYLRTATLTVPTSTVNGYFDITHLSVADVSAARWAAADITASGVLRRIHFQVVLAVSDVPGNGV